MERWTDRLFVVFVVLLVATVGCETDDSGQQPTADPAQHDESEPDDESESIDAPDGDASTERQQMVSSQLEARDIDDQRVLEAMGAVPRHKYVPDEMRNRAYDDSPLPIGLDQTISQPYIVALMTQLLDVTDEHRVLEIGTGSGYQAAVLAELGASVYSIEILCELAERAERDLEATGYGDVTVKCGDGYEGWPEHAPFDRIIVTAAPPEIPEALVDQLAVGAKMVVPVGDRRQTLQIVEKTAEDEVETSPEIPVRFVPMVPGDQVE